jgi:aminopeptidase-like protein
MRTPPGQYREHRTSADDLSVVSATSLRESLEIAASAIDVLEQNRRYVSRNPYCLPQLEKYRLGDAGAPPDYGAALVWVLNMADGEHSLLDVAARSELSWDAITRAVDALKRCGLVKVAERATIPKGERIKRSPNDRKG